MLTILAPLSDMIFKLDPLPQLNEKRERKKFPQVSFQRSVLSSFPLLFEKYFNDNFGFRDPLVRLNYLVKHNLLGVSPTTRVVLGKDGWLFFAGDGAVEDSLGITHYGEAQLRKWADSLELKRKLLNERGILYLLVIVPNKKTIYGEYLPANYRKVRSYTGLDEFTDYVQKHTAVEMVDIRSALMAAKKNERLYSKTDTHWNAYGAFVAYQEIMSHISKRFPHIKADALTDYSIEKKIASGGDLASLIGGSDFLKEKFVNLLPRNQRMAVKRKDGKLTEFVTDDKKLPRLLVYRDSFFDALIPFLSEHFQYSSYQSQQCISSDKLLEMIDTVHPDIVIEEVVERFIKDGFG